jgi:hypothetical protein
MKDIPKMTDTTNFFLAFRGYKDRRCDVGGVFLGCEERRKYEGGGGYRTERHVGWK